MDGLKNLAMIPLLLAVGRGGVPAGRVAALFLVLYAGLRIPIDLLREYPLVLAGLPSGQAGNILMALAGMALLSKSWLFPAPLPRAVQPVAPARGWIWRVAFGALLAVSLVIPSDATRDVPAVYGVRHPGLEHSRWYPARLGASLPDVRGSR